MDRKLLMAMFSVAVIFLISATYLDSKSEALVFDFPGLDAILDRLP